MGSNLVFVVTAFCAALLAVAADMKASEAVGGVVIQPGDLGG